MLIEAIWALGHAPPWLGHLLLTGGVATLAWMHGARCR
jgi:hypothetical protein